MKKFLSVLMSALFVAGLFSVVIPTDADAVPAFARQTEQPCMACHFQHIPKLGAMGRAFKLGGFTDTSMDTIEDMVTVFNTASVVTKWIYEKSDPVTAGNPDLDTDRGFWNLPNETALWFAGRMNDKWGAGVEWGGPALSAKFVYSNSDSGSFTWGGVGFYTDGLGPFFGMDLWNTGLSKHTRAMESRKSYSGVQAANTGDWGPAAGPSTGLAMFAANDLLFASVGIYAPADVASGFNLDTNFDLSVLYRVAYTPTMNNWDLMFGLFGVAGSTKCNCAQDEVGATVTTLGVAGTYDVDNFNGGDDGLLQTVDTQAIGVDFQAQGAVGETSVEVTINALIDTDASTNNIFQDGHHAVGGMLSLGFMSDVVGLQLAGSTVDQDAANSEITRVMIGGWYSPYQNLRFSPELTFLSGDGRGSETEFVFMFLSGF